MYEYQNYFQAIKKTVHNRTYLAPPPFRAPHPRAPPPCFVVFLVPTSAKCDEESFFYQDLGQS